MLITSAGNYDLTQEKNKKTSDIRVTMICCNRSAIVNYHHISSILTGLPVTGIVEFIRTLEDLLYSFVYVFSTKQRLIRKIDILESDCQIKVLYIDFFYH